MKTLSGKQNRFLRGLGHALSPHVQIVSPVTAGARQELERQLERHELIKVKAAIDDRDERHTAFEELATSLRAAFVQEIGKTALFYRANPDLKEPIKLPK